MHIQKLLYLLIVLLITYLFYACNDNSANHISDSQNFTTGKTYASLATNNQYVGKNQCIQCHSDIFETFQHTGMGLSFDTASLKKSKANFNKKHVVFDRNKNMFYAPISTSKGLFIQEFRLLGKDTVYKKEHQIAYIIGSGQHTNSHLFQVNNFIYQLPLTFYTQKQKWDLPPGFETNNARFSRIIGAECMTCHNAYPEFNNASENQYYVVPKGIDCERCHGPGKIHVEEKKNGITVDIAKKTDFSIVNPSKLSWDLQMSICQRCHLQGNAILKPNKTFFDFKPGMHLNEVMSVFMPRYENDNSFVMASHPDRLAQSACFIKSKGKLTCITCHNPHKSYEVTPAVHFNAACTKCHTDCSLPLAKRTQNQNNCFSCHMPKSNTVDIPHVTITDHYIRKRATPTQTQKIKKFIGLISINDPNADLATKAKAYLKYYESFLSEKQLLDSVSLWLRFLTNNKEFDNINIQYLFVSGKPLDIVKTYNSKAIIGLDAWSYYRLGEAFEYANLFQKALTFYNQALNLKPLQLDFMDKKGSIYIALNQFQYAISTLSNVIKYNPDHVSALNNIGFAYLNINKLDSAFYFYNRALGADPDYVPAITNIAGLCNVQGKVNEAKFWLKKAIKLQPNNLELKETLKSFR